MSTAGASDILLARARALAKPVVRDSAADADDAIDFLVVLVDRERMAIPLDRIAAIARASTLVPLPRAVAPVHGVTSWRGRPLTVLTLSRHPPELRDESRFVVLGDARRVDVAVLVDAVDDTVRIGCASVTPVDASSRGAYAAGVTNDAMLVLDVEALIRGHRNQVPATPNRG